MKYSNFAIAFLVSFLVSLPIYAQPKDPLQVALCKRDWFTAMKLAAQQRDAARDGVTKAQWEEYRGRLFQVAAGTLDFSDDEFSQIGCPQSTPVIVYGRMTCGYTMATIQELAANNIPYEFRDVDNSAIDGEMWELLRKNGQASNSINLPVVAVKGQSLIRPDITEVIVLR